MKIPNAENARFDLRKLETYSLDPHHSRGGDKARVFRAALGIDAFDAGWLRETILNALPNATAKASLHDGYGTRYSAEIAITRQNRTVVIKTG